MKHEGSFNYVQVREHGRGQDYMEQQSGITRQSSGELSSRRCQGEKPQDKLQVHTCRKTARSVHHLKNAKEPAST